MTSDAHRGLVEATAANLPGTAWQRCRTHYAANLMSTCPRTAWPAVRAGLHAVYDHLVAAREDVLAFTAFPKEIWRQIWSNNPNERLHREIRRRTDAVSIFPHRDAVIHLVGAVLAEQTDEWLEGRRYLGLDVLRHSQLHLITTPEVTTTGQPSPALTA